MKKINLFLKKVKSKNNLKAGNPKNDNATQGSILIEQPFRLIKWQSLQKL